MLVYGDFHEPLDDAAVKEELRKLRTALRENPGAFTRDAPGPSPPAIRSTTPSKPVYVPPVVVTEEEQITRAKRYLFES